jgi:hypothetical protein
MIEQLRAGRDPQPQISYTHVLDRSPLGVRSSADLVYQIKQVVLWSENHP